MIEYTLLRALPWRLGLQLHGSYLIEDLIYVLCTCHPPSLVQPQGGVWNLGASAEPAPLHPAASCTLQQPNELKRQSQPKLLITITFHFLQINPAQNKSRAFWTQPLLWMFNHNILVGLRILWWLLSSNLWYPCLADDVTAHCCSAFCSVASRGIVYCDSILYKCKQMCFPWPSPWQVELFYVFPS